MRSTAERERDLAISKYPRDRSWLRNHASEQYPIRSLCGACQKHGESLFSAILDFVKSLVSVLSQLGQDQHFIVFAFFLVYSCGPISYTSLCVLSSPKPPVSVLFRLGAKCVCPAHTTRQDGTGSRRPYADTQAMPRALSFLFDSGPCRLSPAGPPVCWLISLFTAFVRVPIQTAGFWNVSVRPSLGKAPLYLHAIRNDQPVILLAWKLLMMWRVRL